jgi:hypothetical protein
MPKLASRKRETFAIEVAAMTPLASAYVAAGYRDTPWARYNASKLAHVPEVAKRIDELQAEFADRSGIRAEYIQRQRCRSWRLIPRTCSSRSATPMAKQWATN